MKVESLVVCSYWYRSILGFILFLFIWLLFIFPAQHPTLLRSIREYRFSRGIVFAGVVGFDTRAPTLSAGGKPCNPRPVTLSPRHVNSECSNTSGTLQELICSDAVSLLQQSIKSCFLDVSASSSFLISQGSIAWHFPALLILPHSYQQNKTNWKQPQQNLIFIFSILLQTKEA